MGARDLTRECDLALFPNSALCAGGAAARAAAAAAAALASGRQFDPMVLSAKNLATWMAMLEFGRFAPAEATAAVAAAEASGDAAAVKVAKDAAATAAKKAPFDIRINGLGVDVLVSQVARRARKRIPTIA